MTSKEQVKKKDADKLPSDWFSFGGALRRKDGELMSGPEIYKLFLDMAEWFRERGYTAAMGGRGRND